MRPEGLAEAELLLTKAPLKEETEELTEEGETLEEYLEATRPSSPRPKNRVEEKKAREKIFFFRRPSVEP